jgi:hypothetical protein
VESRSPQGLTADDVHIQAVEDVPVDIQQGGTQSETGVNTFSGLESETGVVLPSRPVAKQIVLVGIWINIIINILFLWGFGLIYYFCGDLD